LTFEPAINDADFLVFTPARDR
jgi:hypothetical protein